MTTKTTEAPKAPKYKTDTQGNVVVTLPKSGIVATVRNPRGSDLRALQQAADQDGMTDYDLGVLLTQRCVIGWNGPLENPMSTETFDDLFIQDIQALEEVITFFRS